jgi:phage anti-repressor protein
VSFPFLLPFSIYTFLPPIIRTAQKQQQKKPHIGINFTKEVKDLTYNEKYKDFKKKNLRIHQKMEKPPMFMDWEN